MDVEKHYMTLSREPWYYSMNRSFIFSISKVDFEYYSIFQVLLLTDFKEYERSTFGDKTI